MSYSFYKWLHFASIFALLMGLTGLAHNTLVPVNSGRKRAWMIIHGVALLFIIVSGFGMAARLGIFHSIPTWMWLKIVIWFLLGALASLVIRMQKPVLSVMLILLIASLGAVIGIFKV